MLIFTPVGHAMAECMSIRMSGTEVWVRAILSGVRGMRDVNEFVELGVDMPWEGDDASSARMQDDASCVQEIGLSVSNAVAYDHEHRSIETLASGVGIVVEWLDEE